MWRHQKAEAGCAHGVLVERGRSQLLSRSRQKDAVGIRPVLRRNVRKVKSAPGREGRRAL